MIYKQEFRELLFKLILKERRDKPVNNCIEATYLYIAIIAKCRDRLLGSSCALTNLIISLMFIVDGA